MGLVGLCRRVTHKRAGFQRGARTEAPGMQGLPDSLEPGINITWVRPSIQCQLSIHSSIYRVFSDYIFTQNSLVFADEMDSACVPSTLLRVASSIHPGRHWPVPCTGVPSSWRARPTPVLTVCPDLVGTLSLRTLSACHKTRP